MDLNSTSSEKEKEIWKGKIVYNQIQKEILLAWFKHNPHPDKVTMERLAQEIGVPASKIKNWFRNHRWKQLRSTPLKHDQVKPWTQEWLTKASQELMALTTTQKRILSQAFERDPFPDPATRKKLANQIGIQESRILMWFQNQNSSYSEQRREGLNLLVESTNERPDATLQQQQQQQHINLSTLPCEVHNFPPSSSSFSKQTFLPTPLPSHVSFELWDPFQVCVSQGPSVIAKQPTQAMEGGESSDFPLTFMNHLLKLLTPGENSDTQAPFCCQYQEKCQNDKGYSDTGALQGAKHSQPHPDQEQEFPDLGHIDISYIMQWWDKGRQALIAEWEPLEGTP